MNCPNLIYVAPSASNSCLNADGAVIRSKLPLCIVFTPNSNIARAACTVLDTPAGPVEDATCAISRTNAESSSALRNTSSGEFLEEVDVNEELRPRSSVFVLEDEGDDGNALYSARVNIARRRRR